MLKLPSNEVTAGMLVMMLYFLKNGLPSKDAYQKLADRLGLSAAQRNARMHRDQRLHWENRVQQAVRLLRDLGYLQPYVPGKNRGYWELSDEARALFDRIASVTA
ncbi:winged helix-turn-helix domain-containing protein [Paenibacillus thiaminolyticus]|nr:winged helix-turn-helix domain-containing protein [Paenibacillus thiaminolyticus]MCY9536317.1 winged helix-turn-helix domain-containing protein [Paenibacillus thiaminolyticus]MCY9601329.1 winged helix-turn-helix domain-containing protein [Paenibacillus thiaminolyticus]MCY9609350.1 winged helix-turn-helix domain-containing protein [Paenibacillus thiaminolyticus]MCY9612984.1 winged helix-turn-helix domain-containing protein [Paenibacillus thiaminolyticus]MCY9617033.1 winged helix-turn-helix d